MHKIKIINLKDRKDVLVSVIIPTFNGEIFLEECLSALKNQTIKNYEIIVSDGDSEDNTLKIAKRYADKIVISNKRGVAYQQNNGLELAKGNIILFVHQDVALAPNYIESAVNAINQGYILGKAKTLPKGNSSILKTFYIINNFFEDLASRHNTFMGFTHFFGKRDLFVKNKFRQELYWDIDMLKRVKKNGKMVFLKNTYGKSLDFVNEDGRNIVLFRDKKVSFWRILIIRYLLLGALSRFGFKFKH